MFSTQVIRILREARGLSPDDGSQDREILTNYGPRAALGLVFHHLFGLSNLELAEMLTLIRGCGYTVEKK